MSSPSDQLWDKITAGYEMSNGPARIAYFEQLSLEADAAEETECSFVARLALVRAYIRGDYPMQALAAFSWCIAAWQSHPELDCRNLGYHYRWQFKSIIGCLLDLPEISITQINAALDQAEDEYRRAGQSLQTLTKRRWSLAWQCGDMTEARQLYDRWQTEPRDDTADCAACETGSVVAWLLATGNDDLALTRAQEVLAGGKGCDIQPGSLLAQLMIPYLRRGDDDAARHAFGTSYSLEQRARPGLHSVDDHLEFCALTGNEARGLDLLERHVAYIDNSKSSRILMQFYAAAALLLNRVVVLGHGDLAVRTGPSASVPAGELALTMRQNSRDIAERFDRRNASSRSTKIIKERMEQTPLRSSFPLSNSS